MNKIYLLSFIFFFSSMSQASSSGGMIFLGGAVGAVGGGFEGRMVKELGDWIDDSTRSTVRMADQCGLASSWYLVGNNAFNGVLFILKNNSNHEISMNLSELKVKFDSGKERLATFSKHPNQVRFRPGDTTYFIPRFPSKDDFEGVSSLVFSLPVASGGKKCEVSVKVERPKNKPRKELTSKSVTSFEMSLGSGISIYRSDNVKNMGTYRYDFDFNMRGYPSLHHGGYVGILVNAVKGDPKRFSSFTGSANKPLDIDSQIFTAGYSYRSELSSKLSYSLDLGLGVGSYRYSHAGVDGNSENFVTMSRFNLNYLLKRVRMGFMKGDYKVGFSLYDVYTPKGSVEGQPASGHSVGGMVFFSAGG